MQKIVMIYGQLGNDGDWYDTTDSVNKYLDDGWKVNKVIPLNTTSNCFIDSEASGETAAANVQDITIGRNIFVVLFQLGKN